MALDLGVLALVALLAWLGARRGALESGIRLAGLPIAYGGSVLLAKWVGPLFAARLGGASWLGALGAGVLGFIALQAVFELLARGARSRAQEGEISDASRFAGAFFGVARGALLIVPLLWLASFAEGAREAGIGAGALPDFSDSRTAGLSQSLVAAGVERLAEGGDRSDRMTAQLVARPGEAVAAMSEIASDPRMRVLQADAGFWQDLERGDVASALARPTFVELTRDAQVRARLAALGLVAESSVVDAEQFHDEMAGVMAEVAPRIRALKSDPAFEELMADPTVRERAQRGDTLALLTDPRVQALVARVSQ